MTIADEAPTSGSSVEYRPVNAPAKPAVVQHSRPVSAPASYVATRERRASGSTVRYEPIRRPDAITSEALWGHNDDHDRLDDAPEETSTSPRATRDDTPLEDRPTSQRPRPRRQDQALDASIYAMRLIEDGLAAPYPAQKFFRGFGACRGKKHHHEGIDLGGVGPEWGIGTPIRSMAKAEIIFIGTGDADPEQFGAPDKRPGEALRGDRMLPRMKEIDGYGKVYFFTRTKGRWRSGNIMVTRAIDGPMAGHTIRYLHLAAFRPDLEVGDVLDLGEELGLMGGTGVQESAPHLHLDIAAPDGKRVDVAPLLGLAPTASCKDEPGILVDKRSKPERTDRAASSRATASPREDTKAKREDKTPEPERLAARSPSRSRDPYAPIAERAESREEPRDATYGGGRLELLRCKTTTRSDDFASGRFTRHAFEVELAKKGNLSIEVVKSDGAWKPKVSVSGGEARALASGKLGGKAVTSVKADAGTLKIEVTGWDGKPPSDARYTLKVREKCRK